MKNLKGLLLIVGNYGSGKTEIAINLAIHQKKQGYDVVLADLDLVNPYFRTREVKAPLKNLDIDIILPPNNYLQSDLPILTPAVSGLISNPKEVSILDVGGDAAGATVLGALKDVLVDQSYQMIQVLNPNRPDTCDVKGSLRILKEIEQQTGLRMTGIAGNANLIDDTSSDTILDGYQFADEFAKTVKCPLLFVTCDQTMVSSLPKEQIQCPVLSINRQLVPPWKKAEQI
ncbi:MAG: cobalamin biosynthesis protein CbiA [Deltaproteobacteria bacterium]|jgi:hypothetical protein|nr:cobalamin biosynthesis protein CbiA [Deltaproteobacteria bacterium]